MISWAEIVRTLTPIAGLLTPVIMIGIFAWLQTKFPKREQLEKLESEISKELEDVSDRVIVLEERVAGLQRELQREPSREKLISAVGEMRERIGAVETGVAGLKDQLATANDYLHTLIEQGMNKP